MIYLLWHNIYCYSSNMFIYPVFKDKDSYLLLVSQFQNKMFMLTYLEGALVFFNQKVIWMYFLVCLFVYRIQEVRIGALEIYQYLLISAHAICLLSYRVCRSSSEASPWICMSLYPELEADKDISLIRSDYLPNISRHVISKQFLLSVYLHFFWFGGYFAFLFVFRKQKQFQRSLWTPIWTMISLPIKWICSTNSQTNLVLRSILAFAEVTT